MNDTGSSKSIFFCNIAHIFGMFFELSLPSSFRQQTLRRITAFRDQRKNTPILSFFKQNVPKTSLSHTSQANASPERLRFSGTTGSPTKSQLCGLLALGKLIQTFGQLSPERCSRSGASSTLAYVYALTASLACPEQPGNLGITRNLEAVTCDAEAPCSVNTA